MKLIGEVSRFGRDLEGNLEVSFVIKNHMQQEQAKELSKDTSYFLDITIPKDKRSIQQNRYMWKLIGEIDKAMNGGRSSGADFDIYIDALERAGAKCDYIMAIPEAEDILKKSFRAVKFINSQLIECKAYNTYKVYSGSSKMNTKEMSDLVDCVLDMAEEVGIETSYWQEILKGGF